LRAPPSIVSLPAPLSSVSPTPPRRCFVEHRPDDLVCGVGGRHHGSAHLLVASGRSVAEHDALHRRLEGRIADTFEVAGDEQVVVAAVEPEHEIAGLLGTVTSATLGSSRTVSVPASAAASTTVTTSAPLWRTKSYWSEPLPPTMRVMPLPEISRSSLSLPPRAPMKSSPSPGSSVWRPEPLQEVGALHPAQEIVFRAALQDVVERVPSSWLLPQAGRCLCQW
jgi:hypothetical protein